MPGTYKFVSFILADDARREDNGKEILIGVYTGTMVSPTLPVIMPTCALRFEVQPKMAKYDKVTVLIVGPDKSDIAKFDVKVAFSRIDFNASFFIRFAGAVFSQEGTYTVLLGMDEEPSVVSTFTILKQEVPQPQMS